MKNKNMNNIYIYNNIPRKTIKKLLIWKIKND